MASTGNPDGGYLYDIFEDEGLWLKQVLLPISLYKPNFRYKAKIRNDKIYMIREKDDVQQIVVYQLNWQE